MERELVISGHGPALNSHVLWAHYEKQTDDEQARPAPSFSGENVQAHWNTTRILSNRTAIPVKSWIQI